MTDITIEQIESNWARDCKIDPIDLTISSTRQYELHHKYHKVLNQLKREFRLVESAKKKLINLKTDYYEGNMPAIQLKELGWEPNKRRIFKQDLDRILEADQQVIDANIQLGEIKDMIEYLESILRMIQQKQFVIKNIIESKKFDQGGY